ncbi:hypothetical protein [Methylobacterium aerolatum]|uniref:Uncharacterized protein n=1 Tax=Methylobacterium aerolatum TaxID=418708 RepID=A0ABU0HZE6_9HYPH|nr:hypothetical protein [Methylobacterium aerolatum]MDQ0447722.1 hypothetical protein [Methylobacterium aerolatum]
MIDGFTKAQTMTDIASVIERARREGRDLATALRIARATLTYLSGPNPTADQRAALRDFDQSMAAIAADEKV